MIMYLYSNVHPKIQFDVHKCAWFTHCTQASHKEDINNICWYLQVFKWKGPTFKTNTYLQLDCYVDANFDGLWNFEEYQDPIYARSKTGYVLNLGGFPVQWSSKIYTEWTLITTKAKYVDLC